MFAKTIDVVGANGYLGKGFCDFLELNNLKHRKIVRKNNLSNSISFNEWTKQNSQNICVYLADPAFIKEKDYEIYNAAIKRFDKAINCCNDLFIYISSSKVYSKKIKGKYLENDHKAYDELYQKLKNINEEKISLNPKMQYLILRIPTFVDEYTKPNTLFNKIEKSNQSGILQLVGDYSFNHEFLFSKDFFDIVFKLISIKNPSSNIFNISPSKSINIMNLLNPKFRYISCTQSCTLLDNQKLLSYIDFNFHLPRYSIEDNSIYWFKS